ncbi:MAG: hypothetical protein WDM70_00900 [Nitrosomonadales bacterium]
MQRITKWLKTSVFILWGTLAAFSAVAVPGHFSSTIAPALLCHNQIDSYFLTDYMITYFGKPSKIEGGAYWWKVTGTLFGAKLDSIFVNQENTASMFIGAVFSDPPDTLRQNITSATGVSFKETGNSERWISPSFSVLLKYNIPATPSKMYCLK